MSIRKELKGDRANRVEGHNRPGNLNDPKDEACMGRTEEEERAFKPLSRKEGCKSNWRVRKAGHSATGAVSKEDVSSASKLAYSQVTFHSVSGASRVCISTHSESVRAWKDSLGLCAVRWAGIRPACFKCSPKRLCCLRFLSFSTFHLKPSTFSCFDSHLPIATTM